MRTLLFFLGLSLVYGARAQDVCALRVRVLDRAGRPVEVNVSVTMDDGRSIGAKFAARGVAEFCDVGWGTFSVTVGGESCGQVTVKHLYIAWSSTLEVPVIYQNCHGFEASSGCLVLVRVHDSDGDPVQSAALLQDNGKPRYVTDKYGRAVFGMKYGTDTAVTVARSGYKAEMLKFSCTRQAPNLEETIQLRKE